MTFKFLLAFFIVTTTVLDSWSQAQEIENSASRIQVFEANLDDNQKLDTNEAFEVGNFITDESFVSTSSYVETQKHSASELDAMYAEAQQSVINDSLWIAGMSLAVIVAVVVGASWLYNNSTDQFGDRRHDRHRGRHRRA